MTNRGSCGGRPRQDVGCRATDMYVNVVIGVPSGTIHHVQVRMAKRGEQIAAINLSIKDVRELVQHLRLALGEG